MVFLILQNVVRSFVDIPTLEQRIEFDTAHVVHNEREQSRPIESRSTNRNWQIAIWRKEFIVEACTIATFNYLQISIDQHAVYQPSDYRWVNDLTSCNVNENDS